jgi:predicted alpha/beta-hydrolase family hydrolase
MVAWLTHHPEPIQDWLMTTEAPTSAPRLIDGPDTAPATVLLAHGAGAPMDSPFMAAIASGFAQQGWRVVRFEFPYMARMRETGRRQGPDRMPVLQEAFRQQVQLERGESPERPLFIGGKSMGGRVASLLVDELAASDGVSGCLCLGYPFHPPGKLLQLRTEHLAGLRTPTLILQGERDSFGRREEVETYSLSPQMQLRWILSGDHSFKPTRSSGLSEAENWATAVALVDQFLRELLFR